jgi:hypothetical protein
MIRVKWRECREATVEDIHRIIPCLMTTAPLTSIYEVRDSRKLWCSMHTPSPRAFQAQAPAYMHIIDVSMRCDSSHLVGSMNPDLFKHCAPSCKYL